MKNENKWRFETEGNTRVIVFEGELVEESSHGETSIGWHKNRMELQLESLQDASCIIWNYGVKAADEDETVIGLTIEGKKVVEYDGVFSLPSPAVELLKANGYDTSEVE